MWVRVPPPPPFSIHIIMRLVVYETIEGKHCLAEIKVNIDYVNGETSFWQLFNSPDEAVTFSKTRFNISPELQY